MTGRTPFSTLRARMTPEALAAERAASVELNAALALADLRRARRMSQEELAEALNVGQASVAKMEQRSDLLISSLRRFVEAMGGELEIRARFGTSSVEIVKLGEIGRDTSAVTPRPA